MVGTLSGSRWSAFAVCCAVAVLTILDLAKVNVTLGPIEHTLGASSSDVQLLVAGYVLAFGIVLVPAGRLGDVRNRKTLFLTGLAVFAAASLVCALAPSTLILLGGRFLQGIAAGILMPQVLGLIQQLFTGTDRGRAFGVFGAVIGFGTAFGPTIGGLFIGGLGEDLGWRWTFGMNVPLAIVLFVIALLLVPGRQEHVAGQTLDLVGTALLAVTVLLVMLPFVLTQGGPGGGGVGPARWWFLAAAGVVGAVFVWWERRYVAAGHSPVVDFALFRTPSYRYGVLITTLMFMAMPPVFLVVTLFLMQGAAVDPLTTGLVTIPFAFVSAIMAAVLGRFTHRFGWQLVIAGVAVYFTGLAGVTAAIVAASPEMLPFAISAGLCVAGAGSGALMGANQMRTLKHVPVTQAGVAGSFMQVGQRLGNAIGVAIATSIAFAALAQAPSTISILERWRGAALLTFVLFLSIVGVAVVLAVLDGIGARRRGGSDTAAMELLHPNG